MHCFNMKALTLDNSWYKFQVTDIPVIYEEDKVALLNKPGSPILKFDRILRGDDESGLFEGDVINFEGKRWVICYERGFRAVSDDYVVKYLYDLKDWKILGTYDQFSDLAPITLKKKILFKYRSTVFRINDIIGAYEERAIIRSLQSPIPMSVVRQECGMRYNNTLLYLGDDVEGKVVTLRGGRITIEVSNNVFLDLATGGVLNGYIPRSIG